MHYSLQAERDGASFPVHELTHLLDGGEANTLTRKRLEAMIEGDPVFTKSPADYNRPRPERYRRAMRKQRRLLELCAKHGLNPEEARALRRAVPLPLELLPATRCSHLHYMVVLEAGGRRSGD